MASVEMDSDCFRDDDIEDDDDVASQGGKTKEQKKAEVASKVIEHWIKL